MSEIDYDLTDALAMARRARATRYAHEYEAARATAALRLSEKVAALLGQAGFHASQDTQRNKLVQVSANSLAQVVLFADATGIRLRRQSHGNAEAPVQAEIEFDASLGIWVGSGIEASSGSTASDEVVRSRSAATVVTQHALRLLGAID